tara:strand:- start:20 stop:385 length:366 start_codon:yes stop_codon:yes gene_type:complete
MYEYKVIIDRWVDGDTVDVDIDLGFDVILKKQRVRLHGIDAWESRTRDLEEKEKGLAAKEFCKNFCKEGEPAILKTKTYDASGKYGRILGEIWSTGEFGDKSINEYLIERGHAKEYFGGKR